MRTLIAIATLISPLAAFAAAQDAPAKVRLDTVPADFMGRWVASSNQCSIGGDSWLTIDRLHVNSLNEYAFIVSAWLIGTNQLELDLSLRYAKGEAPTARYTRRYTLSADKRTLTDISNANGMVRVKCDD